MFLLILPSPLFLHHVQVLDVKEYFFPFGFWLVRFLFCCSAGGFFSNNASIDFCFICSLFPPHSSKQAAASSRQSKKWSLEWVSWFLLRMIEIGNWNEQNRWSTSTAVDVSSGHAVAATWCTSHKFITNTCNLGLVSSFTVLDFTALH